MSEPSKEVLILLCQTLQKQQETIFELSCATRALVKALEESSDDVALRYARYHQVARGASDVQQSSAILKALEQAIRTENVEGESCLIAAVEGNGHCF